MDALPTGAAFLVEAYSSNSPGPHTRALLGRHRLGAELFRAVRLGG